MPIYAYLHLSMPICIYLYLSVPIYIHLCLFISICASPSARPIYFYAINLFYAINHFYSFIVESSPSTRHLFCAPIYLRLRCFVWRDDLLRCMVACVVVTSAMQIGASTVPMELHVLRSLRRYNHPSH